MMTSMGRVKSNAGPIGSTRSCKGKHRLINNYTKGLIGSIVSWDGSAYYNEIKHSFLFFALITQGVTYEVNTCKSIFAIKELLIKVYFCFVFRSSETSNISCETFKFSIIRNLSWYKLNNILPGYI